MEKSIFFKWSWLLVLSILFVIISDNGTSVWGEEFPSNEAFSMTDGRCGTPPPPSFEIMSAFRAPGDCSPTQSTNLGDYTPSTLYTIPTWVHIIMDDTCSNGVISDAMVESQIDIMNEDYLALMGTPGQNGTNVMVQFCLAGIDRTCNSSYFADTSGFKEALNVDPGNFLNVYTNNTVHLGYSTWPWTDGGLPHDGVVVRWSAFGRNSPLPPYDQGRSATHEIGHYLGLLHTFAGGCGSSTDPGCYSDGDLICDTNPEATDHYGCTQTYSCDASLPDPIHNYMNYTDDLCMEEFTTEQAERMVCILENYRTSFLSSGCTTPPIAECTDVTVPTEPGLCHADAFVDNGSYHPNGVPVTLSQTPPGPYTSGVTNVTLTVTDSNNLTSSCAANITVNDVESPDITCPSDTAAECDESVDPLNTGTPAATDNCGDVTVQHSDSIDSGSCSEGYVITRTWTATDASGNSSLCVQTINVVDTTPPVLSGVPGDITVECDSVPDPATVTASDNCDPSLPVVFSQTRTDGACPHEYTLTRTWTATDDCGNSTSAIQVINVADTTPPVLSGVPGDITVECDSVPDPAIVTASDNCDVSPTVDFSETRTDGTCPSDYTLTRTWTATDDCGNVTSATQVITVQDTTAPVISCNALATITPKDVPVEFVASATDNCDEAPTVEIMQYDCRFETKKGKEIGKKASCIVEISGDTIDIYDSGGVGDHITWMVKATDCTGNESTYECEVVVVNPAQ